MDNLAPNLDVIAANGGVEIAAVTGINLDIDAQQLALENSNSGHVIINMERGVDFTSFDGG